MSSSITTILIIGGTSGIGEAFTKRFHSQGKKVIVTGRRESKLKELKESLSGLETYVMDNTDLEAIPEHVKHLVSTYPDISTVWVNGGLQNTSDFKDLSSGGDSKIINEINTNITAPFILARHFIPHLLSLKKPANFMITSSGLAFVPIGLYPVYCPTKAAVHSFMVALRQQMKDTNVNIIEIAPPRVETDLDAAHKDVSNRGPPAMGLQEYTDKTFEILDGGDAKDLKEVAVGFCCQRL